MSSIIKIKNRIKANKKINYKNQSIPNKTKKISSFNICKDVPIKYFLKNHIIQFIVNSVKEDDKFFAFKTDKERNVEATKNKISKKPCLIAYSKSTRVTHIDHRARLNADANTISTGDGGANMSTQNFISDKNGIRKLTPNECEQLQGYPVDHTKYGKDKSGKVYKLSDNQRYKLCGNGISSPVSKAIIENFIDHPVNVFSTFSGCGGSELLLDKRFKIIAHSEINKSAADVLNFKHPTIPNIGDITKLDGSEVGDFELFIGGFPCQAFSIAGLRRGFDDEAKGQLIYDVFRIIRNRKPKYVVLENVKGLLNHNNGESFLAILEGISNLGYEVDFELVNSVNFGLIQRRERVFILAKRID